MNNYLNKRFRLAGELKWNPSFQGRESFNPALQDEGKAGEQSSPAYGVTIHNQTGDGLNKLKDSFHAAYHSLKPELLHHAPLHIKVLPKEVMREYNIHEGYHPAGKDDEGNEVAATIHTTPENAHKVVPRGVGEHGKIGLQKHLAERDARGEAFAPYHDEVIGTEKEKEYKDNVHKILEKMPDIVHAHAQKVMKDNKLGLLSRLLGRKQPMKNEADKEGLRQSLHKLLTNTKHPKPEVLGDVGHLLTGHY